MWSILTDAVYPNRKLYHSVIHLREIIENAWYKIEREITQNFILSMKGRIVKLIEQNGTIIQYYNFLIRVLLKTEQLAGFNF